MPSSIPSWSSLPSPSSIWVAAIAFVATGCGSSAEHAYVPVGVPIVEGRALGTVAVPPEAPAGRVEVEAFGRVELSELGQELPVLQVRLVIVNERDDQPWVVDARHQLIEIAGQGRARALYASSDHELPILTVPRGEAATLDLYVPPPGTTAPAVEPTQLDVLWQLTTGTRIVAERTRFERLEVD